MLFYAIIDDLGEKFDYSAFFSKGKPSKVPYEKNVNAFNMRAAEIGYVNQLFNGMFFIAST